MSRKSSERRIIRKNPHEIRRSSPEELSRLAAASEETIDLSEVPERTGSAQRVLRDATGRISPPRASKIRDAVLAEIRRRGISGHQLWTEARKHCATMPESAVYEFLSGKRQVGLAYLDAILEAIDLTVSRRA